jgi:hypothetical protein
MKWDDNDDKILTVAWFSAGVSSAVATKLMIDQIDRIIYTHIDDQHEDTMRFVMDCVQWFGKPVEILQSDYKSVSEVVEKRKYINGTAGAQCTVILKKKVRIAWEQDHEEYRLRYVWGMDSTEVGRAKRIPDTMPAQEHIFPLIDKGITKQGAHQILKASGIKRPAMYDLGYMNNNCVGCVKGGRAYWNKIRVDFPEVFKARAELERRVGRSCINGIFLDELDPVSGRGCKPVVDSCGILCKLIGIV